ncbi:SusD/RagB family nutrient-binding outer membrane lipoprotein [Pedobacter psychrodurus]|uniref:SusD/RagB family nutrient-binding outer membrane lipoprotein n=1 Tax=Pedobacter psychrodurus TaxID=2530456 RepID=A0A4R0Q0I3_9SPHI|nr:SusD/RagB family nutrient-binding outer membrane lipoprotein [Pedobacter psychrodurus]TCD25616.1 SusD/RagB family nutrient-binding outer membrane lipoprotein [Pedobacter psychrodurus]
MKKINFILSFAFMMAFAGCKKYIDVNYDPNRPIDVKESLMLPPIQLLISQNINASGDGNLSVVLQQYLQVMALNQVAPNFGTYQMYNIDMDGDWNNVYVRTLNNLSLLNVKAAANGNFNYTAISKILTAYALGYATDAWGDIPYSQAFKGIDVANPTYDTQQQIYTQLQRLLDEGIADIGRNAGSAPGSDDLIYSGDMAKWKKLAYTLKARYYMHLTKSPGSSAAAQAQLALTALNNGMQNNSDDCKIAFSGAAGAENPWQQNFLPGTTFVLANTFVDNFTVRNDPRLSKMVKPAVQTGLYTGRQIGLDEIGSLESYSIPSDFYAGASAKNYLVNYTEALFLKAEATFIVSGASAAQPFYQDGIKQHMEKLGVVTTDVNSYLSSRGTLNSSNALRLIIEEKFISNFLNPENFTDWRRTGYPSLTKVKNALSDIPRRVLYPNSEITANPQPQQKAKITDRLWWDTN